MERAQLSRRLSLLGMSTLTHNSAQQSGGALSLYEGSIVLNNSILDSNTASEFGGAVELNGGYLEVNGGRFRDNAARFGGALFGRPRRQDIEPRARFEGVEVRGNGCRSAMSNSSRSDFGGAFYLEGAVRLELSGGTTVGENCATLGGAVYERDGASLSVTDGSRLVGNRAVAGGGILALGTSSVMLESGCEISANTAIDDPAVVSLDACDDIQRGAGAGVYVKESTLITAASFVSNDAQTDGGAIFAVGQSDLTVQPQSDLRSNTAGISGGAIRIVSGTLQIDRATMRLNTAGHQGGAMACAGTASVGLTNTSLSSNSAPLGGALNVGGDGLTGGCSMLADSLNCMSNTASGLDLLLPVGGGCAFIATGSSLECNSSSMHLNTAERGGGAIATRGTLRLYDSSLYSNRAQSEDGSGDGGALLVEGDANAVCNRVSYSTNTATRGAAAMLASSTAALTIEDATFTNNTARESGGALFAVDHATSNVGLDVSRSTFEGNDASRGGVLFSESDSIRTDANQWQQCSPSNHAVWYGSCYATLPHSLSVSMPTLSAPSGHPLPGTITLYDALSQRVSMPGVSLTASLHNSSSSSSDTTVALIGPSEAALIDATTDEPGALSLDLFALTSALGGVSSQIRMTATPIPPEGSTFGSPR